MNLDAQLTQLEGEQIIRRANEPDLAYIFKNALAQETAYASLLNRTRRDIHLLVARVLEELYFDQLDEYAALLAQHYDQAGDVAKTFAYSDRAGHAALRVYASTEAIAHFTRAIAAAKELDPKTLPGHDGENALTDCYLHRGRALELMGKFQEALANYEEMESQALARDDSPMQLAALVALATIHSTATSSSDSAHAQTLSNLALALARQIGDRRTEARVLWNLQLLNTFYGETQQAVEYGNQSLAISRELEMREQTALTLNDLSRPYLSLGQFDRARAVLEEALVYFRESDNRPMVSDCLGRFAALNVGLGKLDLALEAAQVAQRVSESIGNLWGESFSRLFVGPIYFERGEIEHAIETMRDCIRLGEQSGFMMPPVRVRADLASVYGALGGVREGIELAEQAHEFALKHLPNFESIPCAVLARLYVIRGDLARAEANLKKGRAALTGDFAQQVNNSLPVAEMEIALAQKDYARAIKVADESFINSEKMGFRIFRGEILYLKTKALQALGNKGAAYQVLEQARREAEQVGSRWMLWQIYAALGECDKARAEVEFIAQNTPTELRPGFLNLPAVREVLAR